MGMLARLFSTVSEPAAYDDRYYSSGRGFRAGSGVEVGPDAAMTISTVYACVNVISETMATIPLGIFRRIVEKGRPGKQAASNHPIYDVLHDRPNASQTAFEFKEMMTAFAVLRGVGVAEIKPGPRGAVDQLIPLHPDLLRREVLSDGSGAWQYRDPRLRNGGERRLMPEEVFTVRGKFGKSVLEFARDSFGMTLAMARYQGNLFSRGARPNGALKYPGKLSPEARANLRAALDEYSITGQYSGKPLLLEDGMEWMQVGLKNDDAQFALLAGQDIRTVCRFFRVQPTKVADMSDATYSNVEGESIAFVGDTMLPWAVRWDQSINRDLILFPQTFFAEHNLEGLLKGATLTRYQAYEILIRNRIMTRNEVRAKENMPPLDDGDEFDDFPATGGRGAAPVNVDAITGQLRLLVRDSAARAVRKETAAVAKLAEKTGSEGEAWTDGVREFYREHAGFTARVLRIPDEDAAHYAAGRAAAVLSGADDDELDRIDALTELAVRRVDLLAAA